MIDIPHSGPDKTDGFYSFRSFLLSRCSRTTRRKETKKTLRLSKELHMSEKPCLITLLLKLEQREFRKCLKLWMNVIPNLFCITFRTFII